jgi:hypothetical protein
MVNSFYVIRALICSSSGGTVPTKFDLFCACYVCWLLAGLRSNTVWQWQQLFDIIWKSQQQSKRQHLRQYQIWKSLRNNWMIKIYLLLILVGVVLGRWKSLTRLVLSNRRLWPQNSLAVRWKLKSDCTYILNFQSYNLRSVDSTPKYCLFRQEKCIKKRKNTCWVWTALK